MKFLLHILGHVLAVDADPAVAAEAGGAVLAADAAPPVPRGRLHQQPPLRRQRRRVRVARAARPPRPGVLGSNSIDILNFRRKTGLKTGPCSRPNSVLEHYKFRHVS